MDNSSGFGYEGTVKDWRDDKGVPHKLIRHGGKYYLDCMELSPYKAFLVYASAGAQRVSDIATDLPPELRAQLIEDFGAGNLDKVFVSGLDQVKSPDKTEKEALEMRDLISKIVGEKAAETIGRDIDQVFSSMSDQKKSHAQRMYESTISELCKPEGRNVQDLMWHIFLSESDFDLDLLGAAKSFASTAFSEVYLAVFSSYLIRDTMMKVIRQAGVSGKTAEMFIEALYKFVEGERDRYGAQR